jgi:hypothetical protein
MSALVLQAACGEPVDFGSGPQVWSVPVPHDDDGFLFDHSCISRIDLTLGPDEEDPVCRERVFTSPRNEVHGLATLESLCLKNAAEECAGARDHLAFYVNGLD